MTQGSVCVCVCVCGGYSDIFEQHRLGFLRGFRFKSIFLGSGEFLGITCKYSRVGWK